MHRFVISCLLAFPVALTASAGDSIPDTLSLVSLEHVTIFVRDYDEALAWYVDRLGLVKVEDQKFGAGERWLTVAPSTSSSTRIVLAVPRESLKDSIGHQHNWVFRTEDCEETRKQLGAKGIKYLQEPQNLPWGCQAIIEDLYGNRIVLLGR